MGVFCFDAKLPLAMRLPLSGITVLSLEQAIAAPLASRHLAAWGARVIKIERPDSGDFERLDVAAIANARLNGVEDLLRHPQLHSRKRIRPVASEAGLQETFLPAVTIPGIEPVMGPIPALGEHTDKILAELGLPLGHGADREAPRS